MLRLFVAVDLPQPTQQALAARFVDLPGARWVKPSQLHVTLRFMGQTPPEELPAIRTRLAAVRAPAFALATHGVGCFPADPRRARVLWLGLEPRQPLLDLAGAITHALQGLAATAAEARRPFSPHLTLARFTGKPDHHLAQLLREAPDLHPLTWRVDCFHLYQSTLGSVGAVHKVLATYPLGGICREA